MTNPLLSLSYGPYDFDAKTIDSEVTPKKIGNYAIGNVSEDGTLIPKYVGRSDTDLRDRLKVETANPKLKDFSKFKFDYAKTRKEAFEKECRNYHDFKGQLVNERHPKKPDGTVHECPVEGCEEET